MIYLKSTFVGFVALAISAVVFPILGLLIYNLRMAHHYANSVVGWDVFPVVKSPIMWLYAVLVFAGGFYWEFHRLTKFVSR